MQPKCQHPALSRHLARLASRARLALRAVQEQYQRRSGMQPKCQHPALSRHLVRLAARAVQEQYQRRSGMQPKCQHPALSRHLVRLASRARLALRAVQEQYQRRSGMQPKCQHPALSRYPARLRLRPTRTRSRIGSPLRREFGLAKNLAQLLNCKDGAASRTLGLSTTRFELPNRSFFRRERRSSADAWPEPARSDPRCGVPRRCRFQVPRAR